MKKWTRRGFLGASAAVTAIALGRWQGTPAAAANGDVNLYTSRHYETDDRVYEEFTRQTGIRVNLLEGEADELIARILGEGRNSPADLLITVDAARLWRAEQAGIFAPVSSSVLSDRLPENLRHPEGLWFSLTKRARVIMYNKDRVQAGQLSTYENLADPNWRNQIAIRSSSHVYNQSLVASLIEYLGERETEDWCRGLVRNLSRSPQGNDRAQITAAASGQANLAVANTYYLPRYAPGGENADPDVFGTVKVFFPNQSGRGTHVNISGGGVVKTAPNRENAIRLLEFLTSRPAQELFAKANNEYPAVQGIPLDPVVASFGNFKEDRINVAVLGRNNPTAVRIMDRAGWR